MVWPFLTFGPVPLISAAERSLPSGLGVLEKSRDVTVSPFVTSLGAQEGDGWDLPLGPSSGGLGLLIRSITITIGSLLPIPSWALPLSPKSLSAGAVTAIREPTVAPLTASCSTGLSWSLTVSCWAPPCS